MKLHRNDRLSGGSRPWVSVLAVIMALLLAQAGEAGTGVYPRLEASFAISNLSTDPFNYAVTDVRVQLLQPDGSNVLLPAFFDGGTTWRVRHSPSLPGLYQITGVTLNGQPLTVSNLQPNSWSVVGGPSSPGFVLADPANTNRFITKNGRRYFPLGQDVAWDTSSTTNVVGIMAKLGAAHENWARIWMDHWDGKNLDWPKVGSFGTLSLTVAQKWDAIIAAAEQSGVGVQMTLQHHGQYSTTVDSNWAQNPYNTANGGFLPDPKLFFTDPTARNLTKLKLRYAIARWGYSPALMGWELFNEVQYTDAAQNGQWTNVAAWHDEMAQFIRAQDAFHHLITTSSDLNQTIWNQTDYYQHHDYPADLISALRDAPGIAAGQPTRPIFGAECGMDNTPYLGFHAPLWAGLMNGQSGACQQWYWDHVDADHAYSLFRAGRDFVLAAGLAEQDAVVKSVPHVTCPASGPLSFAPGGGWSTNPGPYVFTVGDSTPDGIATLPSYLQGIWHSDMTTNGYTFLVNYSQTGTFSAQVTGYSTYGDSVFRMILDGALQTNVTFFHTNSGTTNVTFSMNVPAGTHSVVLTNAGTDWFVLGNISLEPYVSILGAYQIANTNFAAMWIWHRTNIYSPGATATLAGTVPLSGMQPGTYSGTWWDTFAGVALSNFSFTVSAGNSVTLSTPSVLRSVAFFAGPPPLAHMAAPVLARNLATNSAVLNLPLVITNAGGLPLAYSLSVTGISPVVYCAVNSTQSGGPVLAWKDISAVGQDITPSFTALTAKNARDEGIAGPINLGFGFPFFSGGQTPDVFTQIYISPNGFITFSPFAGDTSVNRSLPSTLAPSNCVAVFWDDLDLTSAGRVYCATDSLAGTFTVQFQNVPIKGTSTNVTCQVILMTSGEIVMQYQTVGVSNACTVGVQNATRIQGFQAAYNQSYVQSGMAVRLTPTPWLGLGVTAGLVPRWNADTVNLALNATQVPMGAYSATLLIGTADPALPMTVLPVSLNVLAPIDLWRLTNFGTSSNSGLAADGADPDQDGLVNLVEYALGRNPNSADPNPLSWSLVAGHLVVSYKRPHPAPVDIKYIDEVTGSLSATGWNSGPAYVSESVVDNSDGTETVSVTDLAHLAVAPAHFLRVRFSR